MANKNYNSCIEYKMVKVKICCKNSAQQEHDMTIEKCKN